MSQDLGKVKFGNKMYFVMDKFTYKNVEYFYIAEDISDKILALTKPSDVDIEVNFIYKTDDGKYENIVEPNLLDELLTEANKRMIKDENSVIPKQVLDKVFETMTKKENK